MNKDLPFWHFIALQLKEERSVMMLLVTESSGSSPGRQGFKMVIAEDGTMLGSIGGGIMEVKLVELAKKLLKENTSGPVIKKQIHSKSASSHQSGMICSGEQTVIYFRLDQSNLPDVQMIIRVFEEYQSGDLHISYTDSVWHFEITEVASNGLKYEFVTQGENEFKYRETIGYKNRLYIVGGGHCALALSELMSKFDFYIHVIDDRPALNTMEQNIYAHEKHLLDHYEFVDQVVADGPDVYVVVMTLGYRSDAIVMMKLAEKSFAYLGLLGSASKIEKLKQELSMSGLRDNLLNKLHAPVGLKINSHTPEEIAVSIAAEIIQVKNTSL